ncbi:MAG: ABC transporter [Desulfobulbus propionicus]|nr:MAG: ABC transporter [Desulfobulbus propionicus]
MNLKVESARFLLSYFWWIIEPLLFVSIFYIVFEIFLKTSKNNFLLFLVCGKIPFLWFQKTVTYACSSITRNKDIIVSVNVPKFIFPIICVHEVLYKQWAVFLVMLSVVLVYKEYPSNLWLMLLPLFFLQYIFTLASSLISSLMVAFLNDIVMIINMAMMFIMFVSGIFWDINSIQNEKLKEIIFAINPVAFIIDCYRQILMYDQMFSMNYYIYTLITSLILLFFSLFLFKIFNFNIVNKIINQ